MRLWRRGSNHKPLPGAPQAPEQLSAGKDKLPGLTMVGVPAASPRIEMMSEGSSPRVGEVSPCAGLEEGEDLDDCMWQACSWSSKWMYLTGSAGFW